MEVQIDIDFLMFNFLYPTDMEQNNWKFLKMDINIWGKVS